MMPSDLNQVQMVFLWAGGKVNASKTYVKLVFALIRSSVVATIFSELRDPCGVRLEE